MKVREFMTTVAHTCRPEDTLDKAAHLLWAHDCGSLPVIAADGRVLAMITDRDVCMGAFLRGQALSGVRVGDSMSHGVISCQPDDDLAVAAGKMAQHRVRRLPVIDAQGRIAGILSLNDLACRTEHAARNEALKVLAAVCRPRASAPVAEARKVTPPAVRPAAARSGAPASI
jgi:CBS-domain-containing membrane protein